MSATPAPDERVAEPRTAAPRVDGPRPDRSRVGTVALTLVSTLLSFGVLELAARLVADPTEGHAALVAQGVQARALSMHVASSDPALIYVNRPGYERDGVRFTEAHGIVRSMDVEEAKGRRFRVAVLGDSIAAAHPVRAGRERSVADELERELAATRSPGTSPVEVLNFGTDGYGILQEARLLETRAVRFAPDAVVLAYCLNDPTNSYTPTVWFLESAAPPSYLLDFVGRRLGGWPSELSPAHPRYTHGTIEWERLYDPHGPNWPHVDEALGRIASYGRDRQVPALLAMFPLLLTDREPPSEHQRMGRIYERVREAAARHGMSFLDLRAAFGAYPAHELRLLPDDPIHPNALGHRLAGRALAAALAPIVRGEASEPGPVE